MTAEDPLVTFDVVGDGFLYRMVRNIVGTLLRVGEGRMAPPEVAEVLERRDRAYAGPSAPARGLCLVNVEYATPCAGAGEEAGLRKGWEAPEALL